MPAPTQIFISYARKDGRPFAAELRQKLEGLEFSIWQDVVSMESGDDWWLQIKKAIENVQTMVLVLTEAALQSEIVRREWVYARSVGIHILPVTPDPTIFDKAPRWMSKLDIAILAPEHPDYAETWGRFTRQLQNPPPRKPVPFMAEALPIHFTQRKSMQEAIKTHLLDDSRTNPRPGLVTLLGMGGFGKTTLAQAVCYDPEIVDVYAGGVLYATIGESGADITAKINAMVSALKGTPAVFNTREEAARALHELLADRDCLMVLDDVWDEEHIKPFLANDGCARIITTRDPQIAALATQNPVEIIEMLPEEAAALLLEYLPEDKRPPEQDGLLNLAKRLGEWPLLLGIFGGTLRQEVMVHKRSLSDALDWLNEGLSEEGLTVFDGSSKEGRNHALEASMNASLRRYDEAEKYRLYELAIFRDDTEIPEAVAVKLWEQTANLSRFKAERLLRRLAGQFFQLRATVEGGAQTLRLHDAMRLYLRGQLGDRYQLTHQTLLNAYNPTPEKPWHEAADSYLCDHLVYHLIEAGRADELPKLFANHDWMHKRFEQSGYTYTGFLDDLTQAWEIAHAETLRQIDAQEEPEAIAQCIRYALIQTSINSIAANYPPELVAQAVKTGLWTAERALALAERVPDAHQKVKMYVAILGTEKLIGDQHTSNQKIALQTALGIQDESSRLDTLVTLIEQLKADIREQALVSSLDAALMISDKSSQVAGIVKIAKHLEGQMKAKALAQGFETAQTIKDAYRRAGALQKLAQEMEGATKENALRLGLEAALDLGDDAYRTYALDDLVDSLSDNLLTHAVNKVLSIKNIYWRWEALGVLARRLEGDLLERVLTMISNIEDEGWKQDMLVLLNNRKKQISYDSISKSIDRRFKSGSQAKQAEAIETYQTHQEDKTLAQALQIATTIRDDGLKEKALATLASQLERNLKFQIFTYALESALSIDDEKWKTDALKELADHLEGILINRAYEAIQTFNDDVWREAALAAIAGRLPDNLVIQAFEAIQTFDDEDQKANALITTIDRLPKDLLEQTLDIALEMWDEASQVWLLERIANRLDRNQLEQALEAALKIADSYWRARLLIALAEQIDEPQKSTMLSQATELVLTEKNTYPRIQLLIALAKQIDEPQKSTMLSQAITEGFGIHDEKNKIAAIKTLMNHLGDSIAGDGLEAAIKVKDEWLRAEILKSLAKYLKDNLQIRGLEVAKLSLEGISRAWALADFLPMVSQSEKEILLNYIQADLASHVKLYRPLERIDLFRLLAEKSLFAPPIFSPDTLGQIAEHVIDVCNNWEWQ